MGKRLGQHFLKDKKILARIAEEALPSPHTIVIEIGPGHGELTEELLKRRPEKIIAIEKDRALAAGLRSKYEGNERVEIVEGDVREILPSLTKNSQLKTKNWIITGNIPYYLTGYLLRLLGDLVINHQLLITKIVLTVQKEVAERIVASAPHANLLSIMIRGWATPAIAFAIPRGAFSPSPKVSSALILIEPREKETSEIHAQYFEMVKKVFQHPRKTLANNIREGFSLARERAEKIVETLGLSRDARAAKLTPAHIKMLAKMMYN
ncbi:MAG: 16S rRNA (adenine(1518)-N(6)/adenine(1519)-N(6))-dimethyltransferase RsmA [Candidatus Jorgensenbacteria bacterium]|nr:16S rRNA (adenine(1518)-N(6)/adenine(1519)-N(6))-dimethyltransferase RsmA [Candidatus Jorgensenbacteria bacterium]